MGTVRVGVVGVGHLGSIHASIYRSMPEAELVAVVDSDPARAEKVGRELGVPSLPDHRPLIGKVQAISIGEVAIIAVPCEFFTALGLAIKAQSPFSHTIIASCANGMVGYVATPDDFERRGYGAGSSWIGYRQFPFLPHVGQVLVEDALALLHSLR